ncbi:MAG: hypothetical protein PHV89_08210 [Fermentimonas sp.]|jgi:hypothetical protein|nr:hypothetical protein [Fermentimonas sp.]MDD2931513.1 hypothetical protein [Fermentimonas sp.]MDD4284074.1 hypothetical protein [Fermentimonas sp.]MDD4724747.1 hypothetical protein [Fermentimonas sp.]
MSRQSGIKINQFQLAVLLDESDKEFFKSIVSNNVYCLHCRGFAQKGIDIEEIYLTKFNDVMVYGKCKVCNGEVGRLFEFGKENEFSIRANKLRKSIKVS